MKRSQSGVSIVGDVRAKIAVIVQDIADGCGMHLPAGEEGGKEKGEGEGRTGEGREGRCEMIPLRRSCCDDVDFPN